MTNGMETGRRTVKNYLCNTVASVWEVLTDLTAIGLIARYFEPGQFGHYAFVMAFVAIFRMISGMGVPVTVVREVARDKARASEILTSALMLQLFFSAVMVAIVSILINIASSDRTIVLATYVVALAIVFQFLGGLFSAVINAYERMEFNALKVILAQTVYVVSVYCVIKKDLGFLAVFFCILGMHFTGFATACFITLMKFARLAWHGRMGYTMKYLFLEAYPIGIRRFMRQAGIRIDTILLAALRSSVEVGLFHGIYKIVQGMMFVGENVSQAVFPPLSRFFFDSKGALDRFYEKSVKFLILVGPLLALFLYFFSKEIITLVLGPQYLEATSVVGVFSGILVLMLLAKLTERVLIAGNKQKLAMILVGLCLIVNVASDFLLIPSMGIAGAAWATLVSELLLAVMSFYYISKYVTSYPVYWSILKTVFVYSIGWLVIEIGTRFAGPISGFVGGILFTMALLIVFRIVTLDDISMIKDLLAYRKQRKGVYRNGVTQKKESFCTWS